MAAKKKVSKKKISKKKAKKKTTSKKKSKKKINKKKAKALAPTPNPMGRPLIIKTPEEMDDLISEYVIQQNEKRLPLLLTGMILHLGLSSREAFDNYQKRPDFLDSVKRGKLLIECGYEYRLHGTTPTGSIFALKNFGWFDKTPDGDSDKPTEPVKVVFEVSSAVSDVRITKGKKK